jgi:regulator of sigma E protease
MLTLLIAIFSLIILMIIHEFGHFIIAKYFGVKVEEFGIGYPPKIFGRRLGETLYSINLIPLGAFVKIYGEEGKIDDYRSFSSLLVWKRILICLGGVIAFWLAAIIIFSIAFGIGVTVPIGDQDIKGITSARVEILSVQKDSPAEVAGLRKGDRIIGVSPIKSINNEIVAVKEEFKSIDRVSDFQQFVRDNAGESISVNLARNGEIININLTPRTSYPENQGPTGVAIERFANLIEKYPWHKAPVQGIIYTGKITWEALSGIYGFFASLLGGGGIPKEAQIAGPIGITIFLSRAADYGIGFFLYFIGSLTVLLAIFNLFPIPALDGGKLLFLIIEKIKRKPVSAKLEQNLTITCFVLLIIMSIFVTIKFDVPRIIDLWKFQ